MGCVSIKPVKNQNGSDISYRSIFPSISYSESNKLPVEVFKAFERTVKQTVEKSQLAPERPKPVNSTNKDPGFGDYKFSVKKTEPAKPSTIPPEIEKPKIESEKKVELPLKPFEQEAEEEAKPIPPEEEAKSVPVEFDISEQPKKFLEFQENSGTESPLPPNIDDSIMEESEKLRNKRMEKEAAAKAELEEHAVELKEYHVAEIEERNDEMEMIEVQANSILSKYQ